ETKGGRFGVGTRPISQWWEPTVYPAVRGHFSSDDLRLNQRRFFGFDSSVEGAAGGVSSLGCASAFGSSAAGCAASAAFFLVSASFPRLGFFSLTGFSSADCPAST